MAMTYISTTSLWPGLCQPAKSSRDFDSRFVLDLTDEEIGRLMGMSRSAVQRHRTSTLKDLRIKLMAFMPEGG